MRLIKNNLLLFILLLVQVGMLVLGSFRASQIPYVDSREAVVYHIILTGLVILGYCYAYFCTNFSKKNINFPTKIPKIFIIYALVLIVIGVITSVISVMAVIPLSEYWQQLTCPTCTEKIKETKDLVGSSGLPGCIKVFNYAPLGVFLYISSLLVFRNIGKKDKIQLWYIWFIALFSCCFKVLFSLDRLTILAIVLVVGYVFFILPKFYKIGVLFLLCIAFLLLNFITTSRMGAGTSLLDFLVLYANLGLSNFQLLINHFQEWSCGLNTFFIPLYFIAKTFGVEIYVPQAPQSIWGNPQYFYGYLYMDFGYLCFFIVLLLGYFLGIYQKIVNRGNSVAQDFYFLVLFFISTTMVIPVSRATEFWLLLLIIFFGNKILNRHYENSFR